MNVTFSFILLISYICMIFTINLIQLKIRIINIRFMKTTTQNMLQMYEI